VSERSIVYFFDFPAAGGLLVFWGGAVFFFACFSIHRSSKCLIAIVLSGWWAGLGVIEIELRVR